MPEKKFNIFSSNKKNKGFSTRGESIYYFGTLFFIAGIILLSIGSAFVVLYKIHYGSDPYKIIQTVTSMGTGIISLLTGINLMIKQKKAGYFTTALGVFVSAMAIILFLSNYINNWYYPTISYILGIYIVGFLLLTGNAFGNVTLWLNVHKTQQVTTPQKSTVSKQYTDEQIQKDIEETIKQSINRVADEMKFEIDHNFKPKVAKSFYETKEKPIKVKDDIEETAILKETMDPGFTDKSGSKEVEQASSQLAATLKQQSESNKKNLWEKILEKFEKNK